MIETTPERQEATVCDTKATPEPRTATVSDTKTTASDTASVVRFNHSEWCGRQQLADRLDVSLRTIDRRVKRGEIQKRTTSKGKLYRPTPDDSERQEATAKRQETTAERHQNDTDRATVGDTKTTPDMSQGVADLVALVREQTDRIAELERQVGRLLERLDDGQTDASGAADTELEGKRTPQPAETSETDDTGDGCDMTAKEMVDLLRSTAGEPSED